MKKHSSLQFYLILVAAFLGMGMAMPSCPGQQAMQQQIDTLTAQNQELNKRTLAFDSQIKNLNSDMTQVKSLLKPIADAVQAQKTQLDQLEANVKDLQTKVSSLASAKPAAKSSSSRRRR